MLEKPQVPPIHDVDIRLLRVFKSIVECGGLSAAEVTIGVGRSAISKYLSDLESRLAIKLCERGRAGFALTSQGETVYQATIELLDALDQFRGRISVAKGTLTGSVNVWLIDKLHLEPANPMGAALRRFSQRSQDVVVNLSSARPELVEEAVATRLADIAVTPSNNGITGLTYVELSTHRSAFYIARGGPTAVCSDREKLRPMATVEPGYFSRKLSTLGDEWRPAAAANDIESAVQLILTGQYAGLLPEHVAEPMVKAGQITRIDREGTTYETTNFLVFRSKSKLLPILKLITEDILVAYGRLRPARTSVLLPVQRRPRTTELISGSSLDQDMELATYGQGADCNIRL